MAASELLIGTSGWNYGDWKGRFYPEDLRSKDYLDWYARHFSTVARKVVLIWSERGALALALAPRLRLHRE
jgi:hypothetical protein